MNHIYSLVYAPRAVVATEKILDALYKAARTGLTGESLAYAAGLTPLEFRRLMDFDSAVEHVVGQAKAEAELSLADTIYTAATEGGDTKAALELLKHRHGWVAKQHVSIEVDQRISIKDALLEANSRVVDAGFEVVQTEDERKKRIKDSGGLHSVSRLRTSAPKETEKS